MNYEKSGDRKGLKWPQTTFTSVLPKLTSSNDPCKTGGLLCTKDRTHKVHQRDFYVEREATSLHTQNPGDVSRAPSQKKNKNKKNLVFHNTQGALLPLMKRIGTCRTLGTVQEM
jgi:hypothetical protein